MDPFIGEIRVFPYSFAPQGWFACEGQLLPIQAYTALFSIIGTTYGGDGVRTFALPNLGGRIPLSSGEGPGLSRYDLGEEGGTIAVTLSQATVPSHQHTLQAFDGRGTNEKTPTGESALAESQDGNAYDATKPPPPPLVAMDPNSISPVGGTPTPHDNMMPTLALEFCIAWQGIFPPHS